MFEYQELTVHVFFPSDLLGENAGGPGSALGFQYYGGPVVTVLASKTSRKLCFLINKSSNCASELYTISVL